MFALLPATAEARGPGTRYAVGFQHLPDHLEAGATWHGGTVLRVDEALGFAVIHADSRVAFEPGARRDSDVRYVELDPVRPLLQYTPDDPKWSSLYGPKLMGAPAAWDAGTGSTSVKLCVVDTGVRALHEDLAGRYGGGIDYIDGGEPMDQNGHGTHVTGTAAAAIGNAKGVAGLAQVTFLHARALDAMGSGTWSNVASGIRWCADNGAAVVSLSLGGSTGGSVLEDAVNYAWNGGAVVVAAAGNSGPCTNCVLYPAKYTNAIAVGCVTSTKALCSFSSTGPEVDLVAPGYQILSTAYTSNTDYAYMSGTSMSTPHVAGAVALLKSQHPDWTNADIRAALESTAEDLGAGGLDASYGHGLARVDLATAGAPAPAPEPAPAPAPAPAQPDLRVSTLTVSPSAPIAGDTVTLSATVTNQGTASAGASTLRFKMDGATLGDASVGSLASGASATVTRTWTATAGSHTAAAVADALGAVAESDEANNQLTKSFTASNPPTPSVTRGVDLSPAAQSGSVARGGSVTYTFTVANTGADRDTFTLAASGQQGGWRLSLSAASITLDAGVSGTFKLTVKAPNGNGNQQSSLTATLTATSQADASARDTGKATTTIA
ncbi:MAG TPA: S8 family serine peptidase [Candidatus Thermoplasmatota archaeon]|nr:S8 family serine peptidase [Candidatus Thermoplasmatota archaeon]